jgi:hypothetical protein
VVLCKDGAQLVSELDDDLVLGLFDCIQLVVTLALHEV